MNKRWLGETNATACKLLPSIYNEDVDFYIGKDGCLYGKHKLGGEIVWVPGHDRDGNDGYGVWAEFCL